MTLRYVGHCPTPCKDFQPLTWPKGYQPFGNPVLLFVWKSDFSAIYCKLSYKLSAPDIFQRSEAHHHNTVLCRFAHLYTMMTVPLFQHAPYQKRAFTEVCFIVKSVHQKNYCFRELFSLNKEIFKWISVNVFPICCNLHNYLRLLELRARRYPL